MRGYPDGLSWDDNPNAPVHLWRRYTRAKQRDIAMSDTSSFRQVLIDFVGNGSLHRATVSPPKHMVEPDQPERFVFFEAPFSTGVAEFLEKLLAAAWCIDTSGGVEQGRLYGIRLAADLRRESADLAGSPDDMQLLEKGFGGDDIGAVGPHRIHYARADVVDLFVTPLVARRLRDALDTVDLLYVENARLQQDR